MEYANEAGSFNMSGVGGTAESESFNWADLMLFNGTEEKNISDADGAGWVFMVSKTAYLWDASERVFKIVCEDADICSWPDGQTFLSPWTGYWLWSNYNDVIISRRY